MIILGNSKRYATVFGSSASSGEGLHIVDITVYTDLVLLVMENGISGFHGHLLI